MYGAAMQHLVSNAAIEIGDSIEVLKPIFIQEVYFIEHKCRRNTIRFGRGKETINESRRCGRMRHRGHKHRNIYIGRYNMRLFAQIAGTTYDIITPLRHLGDIVCVSTALGKID